MNEGKEESGGKGWMRRKNGEKTVEDAERNDLRPRKRASRTSRCEGANASIARMRERKHPGEKSASQNSVPPQPETGAQNSVSFESG